MPTVGATFTRVDDRVFEVQGRRVHLGAWAEKLPDTTHVAAEIPILPTGGYSVDVFDDRGETLDEGDCACMSTDCSVRSIGCALTCYIFPLNLLCPRCFYCFLFGG